jgi:RNase P subunit RPR2
MNKINDTTAKEIFAKLEIKTCKHCLTPLVPVINCYDHSSGWNVKGYDKKQWLYITCSGCGFMWSLWKLGYSREMSEREFEERIANIEKIEIPIPAKSEEQKFDA